MTSTIAVEPDLEPFVAALKDVSSGQIAVREVKIEDWRPDSRSQVVVYLTPPAPGSRWDLRDVSAVQSEVRTLVYSSPLGDDTWITTSDGDPTAQMERPVRGTKAMNFSSRR